MSPDAKWPWWRRAITVLIVLAFAVSTYLAWHSIIGGAVIGCGVGSACDQVLNSRWSSLAGLVPVSGLAAGAYLAMGVASFCLGPDTPLPVRRLAWRALLVLVGTAAGSALWFIFVQERFVGAFCPYCMTAHLSGLLLALLVFWRAPLEAEADDAPESPTSGSHMSRRMIGRVPAAGFIGLGVLVAGLLAAGQVVFPAESVYASGQSQTDEPRLDPRAVPLIGSPDAPYVVTLLFDYECTHCQRLHFLLQEVVRRYDGMLAFALCPAPLNTQCNPYIPRDVDAFKDSCELARIALTIWVAKREAFHSFDDWMFSLESGDHWRPRTLQAATAKAVELVGRERFDAARTAPWVEQYLQFSVRTFGNAGGNAIPKLVYGSRWVTPQPNDADDLIAIVQTSLGLPKPALQK